MNTRKFFVSTALAAALVAAAATAAMAGPTTVTSTWVGAGTVTFDGNATGTTSTFNTGGNSIGGTASFANQDNDPYNYGVPDVNVNIDADVTHGGTLQSEVDRTASYAPLYGVAGQSIYAYAGTSDGNAALVTNTVTNYASLEDLGHYGVAQTPDGNTLEAQGTSIALDYGVDTGTAFNGASVKLLAQGSASFTQNFAGTSAGGFQLGVGGGDYQLGEFSAQGVGTFTEDAGTTGSLSLVNTGGTVYGTPTNPGSITTTVNYDTTNAGGASQNFNYGISGNAGN